MDIVFATNNAHKLEEIRNKVGKHFRILSLKDIGCSDELPETHETLEENALEKAAYVATKFNVTCFADDTGLEIEALDGRPGVYSARYAGEHCSAEDNMTKVLAEMEGKDNRKARFRTVIALILDGSEMLFEGHVDGHITTERTGEKGFGYDPIFIPEGYTATFAGMSMETKNQISHRAMATAELIRFLYEIT
ncbi:MAG: non-canonical purine NTP diphosphatase [Flavobacteriales bacterium]|nr:non-canonical purine NTP diphosphatase [Flavobacteriales bacterium]